MKYKDIVDLKQKNQRPDPTIASSLQKASSSNDSLNARNEIISRKGRSIGMSDSGEVIPDPVTPQTSEFENWYKNNFGQDYVPGSAMEKPDSMGITDWLIGQTYYDKYNAENSANKSYETGAKQIETQKSLADQQAYIASQKVLQYLKLANQSQGTKGISGTDVIANNSNYQNQLGSNASESEANRIALETAKQESISSSNSEADSYLRSLELEKATNEEMDQATWGAQIQADIEADYLALAPDGGAITPEQWQTLKDYYEQNKDKIDVITQHNIERYLDSIELVDNSIISDGRNTSNGGGGGGGRSH